MGFKSTSLKYEKDINIDIVALGNIKDFIVKNQGTSNLTVDKIFILEPGQTLSYPGYNDGFRTDQVFLDFDGGAGICILKFTQQV